MVDLLNFKIIYSKNLIFLVVLIILINIFLLEHLINSRDKELFISNDLYFINKSNKNLTKSKKEEINTKSILEILDQNSKGILISKAPKNLNIEKEKNLNIKKINDKKMFSLNSFENCARKCEMENKETKGKCIDNCLNNNKIEKIYERNYFRIIILLGSLFCFIVSFALYLNKFKNEETFKDKNFSQTIKRRLLEGYYLMQN